MARKGRQFVLRKNWQDKWKRTCYMSERPGSFQEFYGYFLRQKSEKISDVSYWLTR